MRSMCEVEVEIHGLDSLWWARMASDFLEKKKRKKTTTTTWDLTWLTGEVIFWWGWPLT